MELQNLTEWVKIRIEYYYGVRMNFIMMKNISKAEILKLKEQVAYQPGQIVSKTLAQNSAVSVTIFAFDF